MSKFISLHRHPQFVRQQELIKAAQAKGCSNTVIWEMLDACAEDQRLAIKEQHDEVVAELSTYNAARGRGRHRQVIAPEQAPELAEAQSEGDQPQVEQFDQAAFEADALAAAKALGSAQGRRATA